MENDTDLGGDVSLSVEQAAAAYAKTLTTDEASNGQSGVVEDEEQGETTDDELQASDEDESEETSGDEDENAGQADEEEDGEEPDSDQGRFVASNGKVRLPDGTVSTVADLIQGNLRDRDYRQKTMEAAEIRKAAESQSAAVEASKAEIEQQREFNIALLRAIVPAPPDPTMLQTDPMGYMTQKAQHEQWVGHLSRLEADRQRSEQERYAKTAELEREQVKREWATLVELRPEFKDQKRTERFVSEMREHAPAYGIKPEELDRIVLDHRQVLVLKDAIAWRKQQAAKAIAPKKLEGKPPVLKGGKRLNPADHKARNATDAMNRLKQSGSIADATAAYLASLNKG